MKPALRALALAGVTGVIETLTAVVAGQSFEQSGNPPSARAVDPRPRAAQMAPGPLDPDLLGVWSVAPLDQYQISRGADFDDARPAEHRQEGDPSICEQAETMERKHVDVVVIGSHALNCPFRA
jgi:hypothetical protein